MPYKNKIVRNKNTASKTVTRNAFSFYNNKSVQSIKNRIYGVMFILFLSLLAYAIIASPDYIKDYAAGLIVLGALFYVERKYHLPLTILVIALIPLLLYSMGMALNLFSIFIFNIGYDKYVHFISSFCITIVGFYWIIRNAARPGFAKIGAAMMIALGLGSINEINEFIGTRYFNVYDMGPFSQADSLPTVRGDLQVYDTWWDMIFNTMGALAAGIVLLIAFRKELFAQGSDSLQDIR